MLIKQKVCVTCICTTIVHNTTIYVNIYLCTSCAATRRHRESEARGGAAKAGQIRSTDPASGAIARHEGAVHLLQSLGRCLEGQTPEAQFAGIPYSYGVHCTRSKFTCLLFLRPALDSGA